MDAETLYFGYGSNLSRQDWRDWCTARGYEAPSMTPAGVAWLPNHSLRFHYRSGGRKGGAADVVPDRAGTAVPGVLFSLSEEGWKRVNEKEGDPDYYRRTPVRVLTSQGELVEAITYTVVPALKKPHLVPPTPAYEAVVRQGLQEYNLPIGHLKSAIETFESESAVDYVFVYGTLMQGEQRWPQLEPWSMEVASGAVSGGLYHLGAYPGLRLDENGTVHGEVHRCRDATEALAVLDQIEGCDAFEPEHGLYLRVPVHVQIEGGSVWAWTYVINQLPDDARRLEDGRWVG